MTIFFFILLELIFVEIRRWKSCIAPSLLLFFNTTCKALVDRSCIFFFADQEPINKTKLQGPGVTIWNRAMQQHAPHWSSRLQLATKISPSRLDSLSDFTMANAYLHTMWNNDTDSSGLLAKITEMFFRHHRTAAESYRRGSGNASRGSMWEKRNPKPAARWTQSKTVETP